MSTANPGGSEHLDQRTADWQEFVTELLRGLGYEIKGPGPFPGTLVVDGPALGLGRPREACRCVVLCRFGRRAQVISADDLMSGISEAEARGVMGFDFPQSSADQKTQFEALPVAVERQSIDPLQFVRDNVREPERRKRYLQFYLDLAKPSSEERVTAVLHHPVYWVFWGFFCWALVAAAVQYGLFAPAMIFGGLLVGAFLLGASGGLVGAAVRVWGPYVVGLVGVPVMLSWLIGPYNGWRDWVIALVVLVLVAIFGSRLVSPLTDRIRRSDPAVQQQAQRVWRRRGMAVIWLVVTWIAVSVADTWFGPSWWSPVAPLERPRLLDANRAGIDEGSSRVGIALSGGGYRAALFHAGVLAALENDNIPIDGLASVSGGSIIGGYYVLGGDPQLFKDAVSLGRFNLKRELLGLHNFLRLPCPGRISLGGRELNLFWFCSFGRDNVQGALLDRNLFGGTTLNELADGKYPRWIIAGTDLVTGQAIGFSPEGILRLDQAAPRAGLVLGAVPSNSFAPSVQELGEIGGVRIARLVAASGAFPGAFQASAFRISPKSEEILVSDGGLTDNFGFSLLASAHVLGESWVFDLIIVSDGSQTLRNEVSRGVGQWGRAMSVIYASAGIEAVIGEQPPKVLRLSPQLLDPDDDEMMARICGAESIISPTPSLAETKARTIRCKQVFNDTSTLKDQITADDAQCIFDLGIFTVAANRPEIRAAKRQGQ